MLYNVWIFNPDKENISIVEANIEGLDAARDIAATLSFTTGTRHDCALVGGKYEQCFIAEAERIRKEKEEREKFIADQEAEANALIADMPNLLIAKEEYTSMTFYEIVDNSPDGKPGPYNIEIEDLVYAVKEYLESREYQQSKA
jgi:hypothetical protein